MYQEIYGTFFVYIFDYLSSTPSNYTGRVESFTAPVNGKYKMECWGASGNPDHIWGENSHEGKGGYSVGYYRGCAKMYICVGDSRHFYNNNPTGVYSVQYAISGGGATHISINTGGELKSFETHKSDVLIVAGGGGGCEATIGQGGHGGGLQGMSGSTTSTTQTGATITTYGTGATQLSGGQTVAGTLSSSNINASFDGMFGLGGCGSAWDTNDWGAQGGSGWYGGGGSIWAGCAGGGSSYIGGVDNGQTISGNATMPSPEGGMEIGHTDDGVCIITQIDID